MAQDSDEVVVALDVGSQKVLCVVAKPGTEPGTCHVLGYGHVASDGVVEGTVVSIEPVVRSIRQAVGEAAFTSGLPISRVWAAVGGKSMTSASCEGTAVVRGNEVAQTEVDTARRNARDHAAALAQTQGRDLIKLIPQGFEIGDAVVMDSPLGLAGNRLVARVHAVYGSALNAENLKRCMLRSELELVGYEPHPWAAAKAVLTDAEMICGTAVIDIGAQTTSIAVFCEKMLRHTEVCKWGSERFTRDLSTVLGISLEEAEELKLRVGRCSEADIIPGEMVQAKDPTVSYSRTLVAKTLGARVRELFRIYEDHLRAAGVWDDIGSIVLTGGGALLQDIDVVARETTGKHVRIGYPRWIEGDTPMLQRPDASVAMGLVRCAMEDNNQEEEKSRPHAVRRRLPQFMNRVVTFFVGDY